MAEAGWGAGWETAEAVEGAVDLVAAEMAEEELEVAVTGQAVAGWAGVDCLVVAVMAVEVQVGEGLVVLGFGRVAMVVGLVKAQLGSRFQLSGLALRSCSCPKLAMPCCSLQGLRYWSWH